VKLDGSGSPGIYDPGGPVKRLPAFSGGEALPAGESGPAATGKAPAATGRMPAAAGRATPPEFSLKQLVRSLGLPGDGLSSALVGFARGFSLPLDPALLARLRREALTLKARHGGPVESAALAAAAAAGKGVRLSGEALEQYARAIDPGYAAGEQDTPGDGEGRPAGGEGGLFGEQGGDAGGNPGGNPQDSAGREESARLVREILEKALKQAGGNGVPEPDLSETESPAGFLNRLPGRDGNFWMVFPFKINVEKLAIRLSVWILLLSRLYFKWKTSGQAGRDAIGGITINAVGKERRWVFSIKNPGGPGASTRVLVSPSYGEAARKRTEEEIREVLGDFGGAVTLDGGEMPLVSGIRDEDAFFAWPLFFTDTGSFSPVEEDA
jgi:hypothetical protein